MAASVSVENQKKAKRNVNKERLFKYFKDSSVRSGVELTEETKVVELVYERKLLELYATIIDLVRKSGEYV